MFHDPIRNNMSMRAFWDVQILLRNEVFAVFQLRGGIVAKPLSRTNKRGVVSIVAIIRCNVRGVAASKHHDFSYRAYRTAVLALLALQLLLTSNQVFLCLSNVRTRVRYTQGVGWLQNASERTPIRNAMRVRTPGTRTAHAIVTRTCIQGTTAFTFYTTK